MSNLLEALVRIAARIGRWMLEHARDRGLTMLLGYMQGKIGDFERRRQRARTKRRVAWLTGRIERWRKAVAWLTDNAKALTSKALAAACELPAAKRLPLVATEEICPR